MRLALWFGLVGGLGEVAVHALQRLSKHVLLLIGDDTVWMAPIAIFLFLLVVGFLLTLVQRLRRRPPNELVIPIFILLVTLGILLAYPRLQWAASLALAAGVAFQGTRIYRRRRAGFSRLVRWTLLPLASVVLILAGALGVTRWKERRAVEASAPAGSPNVLLIMLDTVRDLDFDGGDAFAHYLPRLAHAAGSGVRFAVALAPSSWTLPSHASMFTGRWPSEHRSNWDHPLGPGYTTLAETLRQLGYSTAGFAGNRNYVSRETGLAQGFQVFHNLTLGPAELVRSSMLLRKVGESPRIRNLIGWHEMLGRRHAPQITGDMLHWLSSHQDRPFFVFLNYFDAHYPYLPPAPYDSALRAMGGGKDPGLRFREDFDGRLPAAQVLEEGKAAYAGAMRYLDGQVAGLLDSLAQRGVLKNTWVILTSDHGEEFGEHGLTGHGHNLYRTTVQVPLVIWGPGLEAGTSDAPVSLRNIPATVMEWVRPGAPSGFPGASLLQLRATGDSARSELIWEPGMLAVDSAGGADLAAWVRDSTRVIRVGDRGEKVFRLSDPLEAH
ncbi:MAG: sulfatase [Gemmatimonadota bacterium]